MPPKKKNNRKDDDWDAELGETVDPIAQAAADAKAEDAAKDGEDDQAEEGGGGLIAALKKNRGKKAKKGKIVEDFVEGEDPPQADKINGTNGDVSHELSAKAPQEADMDQEDILDQPQKKGKAAKQQQKGGKQGVKKDEEEEEADGSGLKSKKEKEKEKKEREKQRKKEQVSMFLPEKASRWDGQLTSC